ncbi:MAG TPA: hypothetical protein PLH92_13765 [Mycobacterium sp.]|nr:hypothetical protein [Mycobacterium sp.]HQC77773.1 hypothetical protein [Mycobacterium sp.]
MSLQIRFAVVATAALTLAACGPKAPPAASVTASPIATSTAVSSTAVVPAKGDRPTKEFLIGKWGTAGDCTLAVALRADGTSDGPFGNWTYADGVIGFVDEPDFKVTVTVIDDKTMASSNGEGKTSTMTRCP